MIKTGKELAAAAKDAAENHKTLYVLGCFGWPLNAGNQDRAVGEYAYNAAAARQAKIRAADENTFAFDCSGLVKALLWGWNGDPTKEYGGGVYCTNGVPDKNANQLMELCLESSEDFSSVEEGEVVWMSGHIGIYIGDGLAVECTPKWADCVQITAVKNMGTKAGYNSRSWTKHGKLPYITYEAKEEAQESGFALEMRYLSKGCRGEDVRSLQQLLTAKGFTCGVAGCDGIFGSKTKASVKSFQAATDLEQDGVAGPETFAALLGVAV